MRSPRSALVRSAVLGLATLPLLAVGTCQAIAQQSVISGFFNAVTPVLVERVRAELGLEPVDDGAARTSGAATGGSAAPADAR